MLSLKLFILGVVAAVVWYFRDWCWLWCAGDNSVVIQMSAQDAELVAAWQRARQGPKELAEELERTGKKGQNAAREIESGFASATKTMAETATQFTGIGGLLDACVKGAALFKAELEGALQVAKEIAGIQKGLAGSQRRGLEANGPKSDISNEELTAEVQQQKAPLGQVWAAIEGAMKEAGDSFSHRAAKDTAFESVKLNRGASDGEARELAGAAVDLQKQSGMTGRESAAALKAMARQSESSQTEVAKAAVPFLARAKEMGVNFDDASALATSIESAQDAGIGEATQTAEKFLVNAKKHGFRGSVAEQIQQARDDSNFLNNFKGSSYEAIASLLNPEGEAGKSFANRETGASPAEVADREFGFAESIDKQPGQLASRLDERRKNVKERLALSETENAVASEATELMYDALKTSGVGVTRRSVTQAGRAAAWATQDTDTYMQSTAGLVNQRINEVKGQPGSEGKVSALESARDEILKMYEELKQMRTGTLRVEIVRDSRPRAGGRGTAASGLND